MNKLLKYSGDGKTQFMQCLLNEGGGASKDVIDSQAYLMEVWYDQIVCSKSDTFIV